MKKSNLLFLVLSALIFVEAAVVNQAYATLCNHNSIQENYRAAEVVIAVKIKNINIEPIKAIKSKESSWFNSTWSKVQGKADLNAAHSIPATYAKIEAIPLYLWKGSMLTSSITLDFVDYSRVGIFAKEDKNYVLFLKEKSPKTGNFVLETCVQYLPLETNESGQINLNQYAELKHLSE